MFCAGAVRPVDWTKNDYVSSEMNLYPCVFLVGTPFIVITFTSALVFGKKKSFSRNELLLF